MKTKYEQELEDREQLRYLVEHSRKKAAKRERRKKCLRIRKSNWRSIIRIKS